MGYRTSPVKNFLMPVIALVLSACVAPPETAFQVTDAFNPHHSIPPVTPPGTAASACYIDRFTQPAAAVTKKLDILFMTDSSSARDEDRMKVFEGIDAFIRELPSDVDFRIASMRPHQGNWAGRIYSKKRKGLAQVLRSDELSLAEIRAALKEDFRHVGSGGSTNGEKSGLYSMTRAMDDDRLAESRALGFFREDAALAVVFISGEKNEKHSAKGKDSSDLDDSCEAPKALVRDAPAHMLNGVVLTPEYEETITPTSVLSKLKDLQAGRPLVLTAVAESDAVSSAPGNSPCREGWLELVRIGNGIRIDIDDGSYHLGLGQVGQLTSVKFSLNNEFELTHLNVDSTTVSVKVDGEAVSATYIPEMNTVSIASLGGPLSTIDVGYCEPRPAPTPSPSADPSPDPSPEPSPVPSPSQTPLVAGVDALCQSGAFAPKSSLVVGITIDPAEGSVASIRSGLAALSIPTILYTDADIEAGKPNVDGVTVLLLARKVVVTAVTPGYVAGIRAYLSSGGSLFAEYDGAALLFGQYQGLNPSFVNHFTPSVGLFTGNVAGGGLLMPTSFSNAFIIDPIHPTTAGLPSTLVTGLRAAFAITNYPSEWLTAHMTFNASGSTGSIPSGTFPGLLSGRCGQGRIAILPMNHLSVISNTDVQTMVQNTMNWLIGQ